MPENNNISHRPIRFFPTLSIIAITVAIIAVVISTLNYRSLLHYDHGIRISQQTHLNLQTTMNTLAAQLNEQSSQIHQLENQLSSFQNNQTVQLHYSFLEIRHLITLAYICLTIDKDLSTTLTLLQTAQSQLASIQNPQFLPLKNALSSDILKLQQTHVIPINQIYNQLENINQTIQRLSTLPQQISHSNSSSRRERFLENLKQLKNLIVITHVDRPLLPPLSPDRLFFLKESMQFKIQTAQWALLHHNMVIFQSSLQTLYDQIKKYFSIQPPVSTLLSNIYLLQTTTITKPLPDINATWRALHDLKQI